MIIGKNNSTSSLNSFKGLIEKRIGKISKSKKNGADNVYNYYSLIIDRHLYSVAIPKKSANSSKRKNYRNIIISRIKLLNKNERLKF